MEIICFFSGGLASYLAAKRCCEKFGKENVILYFTDTNYEHETTYEFIKQSSEKLGATLVIESVGLTPFDVFEKVKLMGNSRLDPCSRVLKRELSYKFVKSFPKTIKLCFGFDWSEDSRIKKCVRNWDNECIFPLSEPPFLLKSEILREVLNDGLKIPYLYNIGMTHNNCKGFCVKAGQAHYLNLLKKDRELYLEHEIREEEAYKKIGKKHPFLKIQKDGVSKYVTLHDFRLIVDARAIEVDLFDFGGCGCFAA